MPDSEENSISFKKLNTIVNLELSLETFRKFSNFIYRETGIVMKDAKKALLANRLRRRLKELKLPSFEAYWEVINHSSYREEQEHFLDAISTNETYFQRGTSHFKILVNHVLPQLRYKTELSIWSAGCSTGEEPYDLAIQLEEFRNARPTLHYRILATDISKQALAFAKRGEYADRKIAKLPQQYQERYFKPIPVEKSIIPFAKRVLQVKSILKKNIEFRPHNLLHDRLPHDVDLVFCRNVMIYFDKATQNKVVERFAQAMASPGFLFIGHSETLQILESSFFPLRYSEGTVYSNQPQPEAI